MYDPNSMYEVVKGKLMANVYGLLYSNPQLGYLDVNLKNRIYNGFQADVDRIMAQTIIPDCSRTGCDDAKLMAYSNLYVSEALKIFQSQQYGMPNYMQQQAGMFGNPNQWNANPYQQAQLQNMFQAPPAAPIQYTTMQPVQTVVQNPINPSGDKGGSKSMVVEDTGNWSLGDNDMVIVDNQQVLITRCPAEMNGKGVFVGEVMIKHCVSGYNEAIKIALPYIEQEKKILYIEYIKPNPLKVEKNIFTQLKETYNSRLESFTGAPTVHSLKNLIKVLREFMDGVTSIQSNELNRYFFEILKPIIKYTIVDPNKLERLYVIEEKKCLDDIYALLDNIELRNNYAACDFYDNILTVILINGLISSIEPNDSLLIPEHLDHRLDIINAMLHHNVINANIDNKYAVVTEEDTVNDIELKNKYTQTWKAINEMVVSYTTSGVVYSNIIPGDMQYKCGEPGFKAYAFSEPNNIVEGVIANVNPSTFYRKNNLVLEFSKYRKVDCTYSVILDKSIRIGPNEVEY